ncbi:MAG: VOC family protein [Alphaproteobacteria bacterium]|nr:VOC family protein [Alphaproteobacteria bacterium]
MGYHHLALATRNMKAIDHFYREVMGFDLKKVEVGPTPGGGWAKHFFYEIEPDRFIAFWELHGEQYDKPFETALSKAAGLPQWVNHISFYSPTMEHLAAKRDMWLAGGHDVMEIDHNWCHSVYTTDPNGTMVEYCVTTGQFTKADKDEALRAVTSNEVPHSKPPKSIQIHKASEFRRAAE